MQAEVSRPVIADPKLELEEVVAGEGVEVVDADLATQVFRELLAEDPTGPDGPLVVYARGADAGTPFILITRRAAREEPAPDPYCETGVVD